MDSFISIFHIYLRGNLQDQFKLLKVKNSMDAEEEGYYNFYLLECRDVVYPGGIHFRTEYLGRH